MAAEHAIIAREPVMQKTKWIYAENELKIKYQKNEDHIDISGLVSYECNCGAEFDEWEKAAAHLRD